MLWHDHNINIVEPNLVKTQEHPIKRLQYVCDMMTKGKKRPVKYPLWFEMKTLREYGTKTKRLKVGLMLFLKKWEELENLRTFKIPMSLNTRNYKYVDSIRQENY